MDALEFLKTRNRMCEGGCTVCPADITNNGYNIGCASLTRYYPEEYLKIVERWGKVHPPKTRVEKLKEVFPNIELRAGSPCLCPRVFEGGFEGGTIERFNCDKVSCFDCEENYWKGEYIQK